MCIYRQTEMQQQQREKKRRIYQIDYMVRRMV